MRKGGINLKAWKRPTCKELAATERIMESERERIFREVADDILQQAFAAVYWTLLINDDWDATQLQKLTEDLHETQYLMNNPSPLHRRFSPLECMEIIKEKCNIDIRAEFKAQVEIKN